MKPANFPSRVLLRQARAAARALGQLQPTAPPHVADMRWKVGAAKRREQQYTQPIKGRINETAIVYTHHVSAPVSFDVETYKIEPGSMSPHRTSCWMMLDPDRAQGAALEATALLSGTSRFVKP